MRRDLRYLLVAVPLMAALTYYLVRHLVDLDTSVTNYALGFTVMFAYLGVTVFASLAARPHRPVAGFDYDALSVDVFIPAYNEDPALLAAGLRSILTQTRLPRAVWVVDDGSAQPALEAGAVETALAALHSAGIEVHTHRQENAGKRHAQAWAFRRSDAQIFITLDSDTVLDAKAIEKIIVPFGNPEVMCVGGHAVGQNHRKSLLTRVIELGFVMAFVSGRQAEGYWGAVRVNCGILAAYRGEIVRENLDRYLGQRFLGAPVAIGDDRALTVFGLERGRAEFQLEAVALSALPEKFSHLVRQRVRWARSWYWGTLWLLRRPLRSPEFLLTVAQCAGMLCYLVTISTAVVGVTTGLISPRLLWMSLLVSMAIGITFSFRYVAWGRHDEPVRSRVFTWLLSPLSSLLYMFVLVPLYWYAAFTLKPKTWGTRQSVEVGLHEAGAQTQLDAA